MSASSAPAPAPVLLPLTGLRFVAALGIVVYHYGQPALATAAPWLVPFAHHAETFVSLFFVLSGFILAHTYLLPAGTLRTTPPKFWQARIARIVPVYLLAFLIAAPLAIQMFIARHPHSPFAIGRDLVEQALLCLTFTQAWLPKHAILWNGAAWSLSVEAFFYLLFPVLAPKIIRLPPRTALLATLGCVLLTQLPALLPATLDIFCYYLPLCRLPEFLLGILTLRAYRALPAHFTPYRQRLLATLLPLSVLLALGLLFSHPGLTATSGQLAPLFALLILTLALGGGPLGRLLATRPLVLLGEASYSLYILHMAVIPLLMLAFPTTSFWPFLLCLVTLSVLVFGLIEQPASRFLRQRRLPFLS